MTLSRTIQVKSDFKSEIDCILLEIKEIKPLKIYEIAEILGYEAPETVTRGNSKAVLNALKLLLENLQLRAELQRIEAAKRAFYTPSAFMANDQPVNSEKVQREAKRITSYAAEAIKQRRRNKT